MVKHLRAHNIVLDWKEAKAADTKVVVMSSPLDENPWQKSQVSPFPFFHFFHLWIHIQFGTNTHFKLFFLFSIKIK